MVFSVFARVVAGHVGLLTSALVWRLQMQAAGLASVDVRMDPMHGSATVMAVGNEAQAKAFFRENRAGPMMNLTHLALLTESEGSGPYTVELELASGTAGDSERLRAACAKVGINLHAVYEAPSTLTARLSAILAGTASPDAVKRIVSQPAVASLGVAGKLRCLVVPSTFVPSCAGQFLQIRNQPESGPGSLNAVLASVEEAAASPVQLLGAGVVEGGGWEAVMRLAGAKADAAQATIFELQERGELQVARFDDLG